MEVLKRLLYLGDDEEFFRNLERYALAYIKKNYETQMKTYESGALIDSLTQTCFNIVFIDFTTLNDRKSLFEELIFIKKVNKFKSILFGALLSDTSNVREQLLLYSSGFQLGYVKGADVEDFLADSFYIGLAEKMPMPTYAKARKINKELRVAGCSTLTSISIQNLKVESDIESDSDHLELEIPLFKDLERVEFKVKSHSTSRYVNLMTDNYVIEYPYVGPWDEVSIDTIQEETVESWLELNSERLVEKQYFLWVLSNRTEIYRSLLESMYSLPFFIEANDKIDFETIKPDLMLKRPPLIFMDLEEDGPTDIDSVSELVNNLRGLEQYKPVIVVLNNPSSASALQKVYGYDNIVCIPQPLSVDIFKLFVKTFLDKSKRPAVLDGLFFAASDPIRAIDVFLNVIVTSLSEHEITFLTKADLPMFTVLHLNLPIECFVTIIPSYFELEKSFTGKHYMGIIHGISEESKQSLRKLVNQMIYQPIKDFSYETIHALLIQKVIEEKEVEPIAQAKEPKEEVINYETFKRPTVRGKSKL